MVPSEPSLPDVLARCRKVLAHAWMVRTFVKHSEEADDFPELLNIVRAVFDLSRALETQQDDPAGYVRMLEKKLGKLKKAAAQFRADAALASSHTNFQEATVSIEACVEQLDELLEAGKKSLARDNTFQHGA